MFFTRAWRKRLEAIEHSLPARTPPQTVHDPFTLLGRRHITPRYYFLARNSAVSELHSQIGGLETRLKQLECPHERVRECVTKSVPEYELVYADADKPREEWTRRPLSPTTRIGSRVVKTCLDCGKEIGNDFVPDEEA